MNNLTVYLILDSLNSLHPSTSKPVFSSRHFLTKIQSTWNKMIAMVTAGKEPKIWLSSDAEGKRYWNAFDPQTHCFVEHLSEEEMRIWIEERYRF
ncbi:hypothetical protein [Planktothrix mougeotii]|uniref:Uncharacterized protein n=1 Tax=Planktothrix mougeotii LEGE 06226 TaxID=1828728 RepID=A0ABR9U734_9CYAN|nr:hypothetical protein [Planktothrix mougeotii]MBE9142267.1 hypothetical protein [Planktothrix mougeotii LEGE 06226]